MQDNETEPTPADHIHDGSESAALEQQQTTDPSLSTDPIAHNSSSDEEMAPPETATLPEDDDDEDDGPVELEDPFSGSENAKPVMLDGEDEEIEEPTPAVGEMDWYIKTGFPLYWSWGEPDDHFSMGFPLYWASRSGPRGWRLFIPLFAQSYNATSSGTHVPLIIRAPGL